MRWKKNHYNLAENSEKIQQIQIKFHFFELQSYEIANIASLSRLSPKSPILEPGNRGFSPIGDLSPGVCPKSRIWRFIARNANTENNLVQEVTTADNQVSCVILWSKLKYHKFNYQN